MISTIDPHPDAPLGSVTELRSYSVSDFAPTDAILCRLNAPLIAFAFDLIRKGIACHVLGRDIAAGLEHLLDRVARDNQNINDAQANLTNYCLREVEKLRKKDKRAEAGSFEDKCRVLSLFLAQSDCTSDCHRRIVALFANGDGVTLSTIHKAKGLEWPRVYLLDRNLLPSPWAESPDELRQERNLEYVAVTRAKLDLVSIKSNNWKQ